MEEQKSGLLYAISAFLVWGILPVYWKLFGGISTFTVLFNRAFWSMVFLLILVLFRGKIAEHFKSLKENFSHLAASSFFLIINWFIYIYAMSKGHLIEASLGYFICPLTSMLLGVVLFKERLSTFQKMAATLVFFGIALRIWQNEFFPWISLGIAFSFSFYSSLSKHMSIPALNRLGLESFFMVFYAGIISFFVDESLIIFFSDWKAQTICVSTGPATFFPAVLYGIALRKLPLTFVALLQYICPTVIFLCGILIYNEKLDYDDLSSFALIWTGIIVYLWDVLKLKAAIGLQKA